jgi:hypothetical protein
MVLETPRTQGPCGGASAARVERQGTAVVSVTSLNRSKRAGPGGNKTAVLACKGDWTLSLHVKLMRSIHNFPPCLASAFWALLAVNPTLHYCVYYSVYFCKLILVWTLLQIGKSALHMRGISSQPQGSGDCTSI